MGARAGFGVIGVAMMLALPGALAAEPSAGMSTFAQAAGAPVALPAAAPAQDNSPEAIMRRRFPQKVRVGDLIGLPMLDDDDVTLGHVRRVVRTPEGKIKLIVGYSKWFGWFGRPVAVPIEVVAILARQIASLDMPPSEYEAAPTWTEGKDMPIADDDIIHIALTRR
jgi:hypothetical protein